MRTVRTGALPQARVTGDHRSKCLRLARVERPRATVFGQRLPARGCQSRRSFSQIDNWCKKAIANTKVLCPAAVALEVQKIKNVEP